MSDADFTSYEKVLVQDGGAQFNLTVGTGKNISYGGQIVSIDTEGLVQVSDDTALEYNLGVAATPAAAGEKVLVYGQGNVCNCLLCNDNDSITAGDLVGVYSSKPGSLEDKSANFQTIANYSDDLTSGIHLGYNEYRVLGVALETFTGTLPIRGEVLIMPQVVRETNVSYE